MVRYPRLRGFAINVLNRISVFTNHLAKTLSEDYEGDLGRRKQIEAIKESISALSTKTVTPAENSTDTTSDHPSRVQTRIEGELRDDTIEKSEAKPEPLFLTAAEGASYPIKDEHDDIDQKSNISTIVEAGTANNSNFHADTSTTLITNDDNFGTKSSDAIESKTECEVKRTYSNKRWGCHSKICRSDKGGTVLRFNDLSRVRTFEKGSELQGSYAEDMVSTYEENGSHNGNDQGSKLPQMSVNLKDISNLNEGEFRFTNSVPNMTAQERKRKAIRFNDVSRMIMFDKDEGIPENIEEQLVPTFPPRNGQRKRRRYNPLEDEYPSDIYRPRKKRKQS